MFTFAMLMRVAEGALKRLTPEKGVEVRESRHGIKNFGLLSVGDPASGTLYKRECHQLYLR